MRDLTLIDIYKSQIIEGGIHFKTDPFVFRGDVKSLVILLLDKLDDEDIVKQIRDVATGIIVAMGMKRQRDDIVIANKSLKIDFV